MERHPAPECDALFSLGTNCEVSFNLRSFFGEFRSGLVDWFITPICIVPWLIERRFALVGPGFADELAHISVDAADSIVHQPSGILLHHAFTRDAEHKVVEGWRDEIDEVAAKYRFLGERMDEEIAQSNRPALFINRLGAYGTLRQDLAEACYDPAIYPRIVSVFRNAYPRCSPLFYVLNGHEPSVAAASGCPGVVTGDVVSYGEWHDGNKDHFGGCKRGWTEALAATGLRLVRHDSDATAEPELASPK